MKTLLIDDDKDVSTVAGLIYPGDSIFMEESEWQQLHAKRLTWEKGVTWARSGEKGMTLVKKGSWNQILLDHDLGADSKISGSDISSYLKKNLAKLPTDIYLVSFNPWGRKKMYDDLKKFYAFQDTHFVIIHLFGKVEE